MTQPPPEERITRKQLMDMLPVLERVVEHYWSIQIPRPVTTPRFYDLDEALRWVKWRLEKFPVSTSCSTCSFVRNGSAYCSKWKASIPDDAKEEGCSSFEDWMDIPF